MTGPGPRRLSRREVGPAAVDEGGAPADTEQRRLAATVARLRLELARLRGELDDEGGAAGEGEARPAAVAAGPEAEEPDLAAEADARALEAEHRVRRLAEELGSERRALDLLRTRLASLEEAGGRRDALLADTESLLASAGRGLEQVTALEAALAEERQARIILETLRDGLEAAMEEQRRRHEREVTDVQEAAEERRAEQTLTHLRELEGLRGERDAALAERAGLSERLEEHVAARALVEDRARQLDREVDELRNWISAVESRSRGRFRLTRLPPSPGPFPPRNVE